MDVKPRPLSCMKKLSLTCEIKLQIHRLGIEKTLPAGPRELCRQLARPCSWPGDRGQELGQSQKVLQRVGGMKQPAGRDAAAMGNCPEQPAGISRRGEKMERASGICQAHAASPLLLSVA